MAPATSSPAVFMSLVAACTGAVMFSTPMAWMQAAVALVTEFCRLLMDVAMPAVPFLACSVKLSKPA